MEYSRGGREKFPRYTLVDPMKYADLLNAQSYEVEGRYITSPETQHVVDELLRIAAGKDVEGGAQMVGLAAPQIGVGERIAIIDRNATGMRERQHMRVMINPNIIAHSDDFVDGREGCWSCGSYCANVPRWSSVTMTAFDREGNAFTEELNGFTARIAQHEIDHLDGIRCIDRVPVDQPERLHRVDLNNKVEFDRYRTEWPHWPHHFPRSEWLAFREGHSTQQSEESV